MSNLISNLKIGNNNFVVKDEYSRNEIETINSKINSLSSGSPLAASSVDEMTDTSKIYVNTTDGNWYYYNGTTWVVGGVYQSTVIADNSIYTKHLNNEILESDEDNMFNPNETIDNIAVNSGGVEVENTEQWCTKFIPINKTQNYALKMIDSAFQSITNHRIVVYDSNKILVSVNSGVKLEDLSFDELTTDTGYIRITFRKFEHTYSDRLKMYMYNTNSAKYQDYKPYYKLNNDFIRNIISYDNLNSKLKNMNFIPELNFIIGSIKSADGETDTSYTNRICTPNYIGLPYGYRLKSKSGFWFMVYKYSNDLKTYENSGFTQDYKIENSDSYYRLILKFSDDRDITDDNINELINSIYFDSRLDSVESQVVTNPNGIYYGEKITLDNKLNHTTMFSMNTESNDRHMQGGAVYNNLLFQSHADGWFNVYDLNNGDLLSNFKISGDLNPHCNSVCFGNEKYSSDDEYPLLYVNAYNNTTLPKGTCYVHRLMGNVTDGFSTTLVQTIQIGFTENNIWTDGESDTRPYGNFAVDCENNFLYVYTLLDTTNVTRIFKFNLPTLSNGTSILLNQEDIIEYYDVPYIKLIQDNIIYNDKLFIVSGYADTVPRVSVIDLIKKKLVSIVKLDSIGIYIEPESVNVYENSLIIGFDKLYKIIF